jgi:hypothetical protein
MLAARTYKTKKELKSSVGKPFRYTETSPFPEYTDNGNMTVVGPSAYDRKWYATVTTKDGLITKVK